jgi:carbamoyl-phosphate synthase large subunit
MEKIMILGAGLLQIPLIKKAKEMGLFVILISPEKSEEGFMFADEKFYVDVRNQEQILKIAEMCKIDGIITDQTDIPVRTVAYVAENLGLHGIGYKTACLFTNKYLMREKCKELDFPVLKYKVVHNLKDAEDFYNYLNGDAILKPVDNQGSRGVVKIDSLKKLRDEFSDTIKYSPSQSVLLEQYVEGIEFVVEGIALNYEFKNLICGDTYYFKMPDTFAATQRKFPSRRNKELVQEILMYNKKLIEGFGLKQGITHSEYIVDGKTGQIYLLETAARGGGVFISSDLISISTGICTEEFLINIALGRQKTIPEIKNTSKHCCYIAFYLPVGEVWGLQGINQVKALNYVHRHNLDTISLHHVIKPHKDKTSRKFIILSADSDAELENNISEIKEILKIEVNTENGIRYPIWE